MSEDLATLSLAIDSGPAAQLTTELNKLTQAAVSVDATTAKTASTVNNVFNVTMVSVAANADAASSALGKTVQAANDATGALGRAAQGASTVSGAMNTVAGGAAAVTRAVRGAADATQAHSAAVNDNVAAHAAHARVTGNTTIQMLELGHVFRSVTDEVIAGQSPIRAIGLEFGRIIEIVGQGGLGGALSLIGSKLAGLTAFINPVTLITASIAAMGYVAYSAASNVSEMQKELDRSVSGSGRVVGLSGAGLNALAESSAHRAGISTADARSGAEAMAATGRYSADGVSRTLQLTRGYAGAYDVSNGDAATQLAAMFADPTKGVTELDKRLGFLNDTTLQTVRTLQAQGDAQGALRVATEAASTSLNEMTKPDGAWARFVKSYSDRNEAINAAVAGALAGPTERQEYDQLSSRPRYGMMSVMEANENTTSGRANDIAETMRNRILLQGQTPLMASEAATQLAGQQSMRAGDALRRGDPDVGRYQELLNQRQLLSDAASNPLARQVMKSGVGQDGGIVSGGELVDQELARVTDSLGAFKTSLQRLREEGELSLANAAARTQDERDSLSVYEAYTRALESGRGKLEAATAAENARTLAVTRATESAINEALPDLQRRQQEQDRISALGRLANTSGGDAAYGLPVGTANSAFSNATIKSLFSDPLQQMAQSSQLTIKSIDDYTIAERLETETRRTALQVLKETGDVTRANIAVENTRNEIIAKANETASDRADAAVQSAGLVGLRSYDRAMQEIANRYHGVGGYDKDEADKSELTQAMDPVKRDLARATSAVTDALSQTPEKITHAGDALVDSLNVITARLREIPAGGAGALPGGFAGDIGKLGSNEIGKYSDRGLWATNDLIRRGIDPSAAAGFVGGLTGESGVGLDPHATNPQSGAYGIEQDLGVRKTSLLAMPNPDTFETQWKHLIDSMGTSVDGGAWDMLQRAKSVQAGLNANLAYEGPSAKEIHDSYGVRMANGNALAAQNGALAGAGGAPATTLPAAVPLPPERPAGLGAPAVALTTAASNARGEAAEQAAAYKQAYTVPLTEANQRLDDQLRLLEVQRDSVGKTAEQLKGATAAQQMLNDVTAKSTAPVTPEMLLDIQKYGDRVTDVAEKTKAFNDSQQAMITGMDDVRSISRGALGTLVEDLKSGKSASDSFKDALEGIGNKLIDLGENSLISGLFGKAGTTGQGASGGLFGNALSSLFSGGSSKNGDSLGISSIFPHFAAGTDDFSSGGPALVGEQGPEIVNLPAHSQVVPNAVAFGGGATTTHNYVQAGSSVVVQGNADNVTVGQLHQELERHGDQVTSNIQRNLGTMQGNYGKRWGG